MKAMFMRLIKDEAGQGMTEYGLIIALVAILVIGALTAMSGALSGIFTQITTAL